MSFDLVRDLSAELATRVGGRLEYRADPYGAQSIRIVFDSAAGQCAATCVFDGTEDDDMVRLKVRNVEKSVEYQRARDASL